MYKLRAKAVQDGTPLNALDGIELPRIADGHEEGDSSEFGFGGGPERPAKRARVARALCDKHSDSSDSPAPPLMLELPAKRPDPLQLPCASSSSEASGFGVGGRSITTEWHQLPLGAPLVKLDTYKPRKKHMYRRWICKCPHHSSCEKKRSVDAVSKFGKVEPLAFLAAWAAAGDVVPAELHGDRNFAVSEDVIEEWAYRFESTCDDILKLLDE